jgi:hypothetical protein
MLSSENVFLSPVFTESKKDSVVISVAVVISAASRFSMRALKLICDQLNKNQNTKDTKTLFNLLEPSSRELR